ncbi:class I SAM-dependent methyltransferase [Selenomonas sp. AB3002]|uniref:class I SAM-dependent methyltransferase n=1 Tax=Selenomonas sp. AB3002 TaxID=1392502 RepID=UPI000B3119BD
MDEVFYGNLIHKMRQNGVAIYGAGDRGELLFDILSENGYVVKCVVDRVVGKKFKGLMTIGLGSLEKGNDYVCIISPNLSKQELDAIRNEVSEVFKNVLYMNEIEWMYHFHPEFTDDMDYKAAKPFNFYESPYANKMECELSKKWRGNSIKNVAMNIEGQLAFMKVIGAFAKEFYKHYSDKFFRYRHNDMFEYGDAIVYHSMIRHYNPKRIIEIGSGYSTAVALDTIEFWDCSADMTCIEPYPNRLYSIMKKGDEQKLKIVDDFVQNIDLSVFDELEKDDVLFIDSSHVLRSGGDVVMEFLQILPRLKKGVIIHVHDIFYPFEYPSAWIKSGRPYTEAFLLHALLMDNPNYELLFWEDYIGKYHKDEYEKERGGVSDVGSSFWMRKN